MSMLRPNTIKSKKLSTLLPELFRGQDSVEVYGISTDSREVIEGDLFFAVRGQLDLTAKHAREAVNNGAIAIITNDNELAPEAFQVPLVFSENLYQLMSSLSAEFYDYPSESIDVVAITGTNGKTSCSFWLSHLLNKLGQPSCQIGTLGYGNALGQFQPTFNTTPAANNIQQLLLKSIEDHSSVVVLEASSHGLLQKRLERVCVKTAIFTNLTRDHLDYHQSMAAYIAAKLLLFKVPSLQYAIVNIDDEVSDQVINAVSCDTKIVTYSLRNNNANLYFENIKVLPQGHQLQLNSDWGRAELITYFLGEYNLSNLLAVIAAALVQGNALASIVPLIAKIPTVPGRLQVVSEHSNIRLIVDYAHTPDAVSSVLKAVRAQCAQKIIVVLGCGGNRDKDKRQLMAQAAVNLSDVQVFTSDNPRFESTSAIIEDMLLGLEEQQKQNLIVQENRKSAIAEAVNRANDGDTVLVLGKGHEGYQEINGSRVPFNDVEIAREIIGATSINWVSL